MSAPSATSLIKPTFAFALLGMFFYIYINMYIYILGRQSCSRRRVHSYKACQAAAAAPVPKLSTADPCVQESSAQHE